MPDSTTVKLFRSLETAPTIKHALEISSRNQYGFCLPEFLKKHMLMLNYKPADLIRESRASVPYVYQVLKGGKIPGRNMLIVFALALKLNLSQTQDMLAGCGAARLFPRIRRDALLVFMISHRFSISQAELSLTRAGEAPLIAAS
jgi:hypothetical protein